MTDKEKIKLLENTVKAKDQEITVLKAKLVKADLVIKENEIGLALIDRIKKLNTRRIDLPTFKTDDVIGLYNDLVENGNIVCSFEEFSETDIFQQKIEFIGSMKELSLLADVIDSKHPFSVISFFFYLSSRGIETEISNKHLKSYYGNIVKSSDEFANIIEKYK